MGGRHDSTCLSTLYKSGLDAFGHLGNVSPRKKGSRQKNFKWLSEFIHFRVKNYTLVDCVHKFLAFFDGLWILI